ncbi:MAG: N-(5'-phosphoribosyl)anthranilate isomerase [Alphaproteobacteria bacterium]
MSKWIDQIFESQIAKRGGVVRRKMSSIQRYTSLDEVKKEAERRGYHIIQHGDQWLIFCDTASVSIIV